MKSLKEKKMLVSMMQAFGQEVDPKLLESIRLEEELNERLGFGSKPIQQQEEFIPLVEEIREEPKAIYEVSPPSPPQPPSPFPINLNPPSAQDIVSRAADAISKTSPVPQSSEIKKVLEKSEVELFRKQLNEIMMKMNTLAWGGGGTGVVRMYDTDDFAKYTIGNVDHVLRYNASSRMFFLDYLSGDQGPVRSMTFDTNGPGVTPTPGMLAWNNEEECLNIFQPDNTTLQVGLENYIRVTNTTGNTLPAGTLVRFAGVNGGNNPTCVPHISDGTIPPLYVIGVLTEDVANSEIGRATNFGKVRQIDTTGTASGETWQIGDLLWASPSTPGLLTKHQPTAPNVATSIAAVTKVGVTDGEILVRPTMFPRLYYGSFSDTTTQTAAASNTPTPMLYNTTDFASGHVVATYNSVANSGIKALNHGLYNYQFSSQFASTAANRVRLWVWIRKNGNDIPNTATVMSIESNGGYAVAAWNYVVSMEPNDVLQFMWATEDHTKVSMIHAPDTTFCPSIPSVILTVTQVNL